MFPIGGLVLYTFFGRSIKNKRMISRRNQRRLRKYSRPRAIEPDFRHLPPELRQLIDLGRSMTGSVYLGGNEIEVFNDGTAKKCTLCGLIGTNNTFRQIAPGIKAERPR